MADRPLKKRSATELLKAALRALPSDVPGAEASATTAPIVAKRRGRKAKVATTIAPNYRVTPDDRERVFTQPAPQQEKRWLRWLVRFVQLDAQEVAVKNWVATFQGFAHFASKWATPDLDEETEVDDPVALAGDLHSGFKSFIDQGEWETPAFRSLRLHVCFGTTPEVVPIGTVTDVIIFGAAQLLLKHGRRIRRCAALDCQHVFLAHKRQVHCSPRCRTREKQREFIDRKGGAEGYARYRAKKRRARLHKWRGPNRRTKTKEQGR